MSEEKPTMNPSPALTIKVEVDARHLLCPLPLLRAESAMRILAPGEILALVATDPGLDLDLPAWCVVNGHELLELRQHNGERIGLVRKGND